MRAFWEEYVGPDDRAAILRGVPEKIFIFQQLLIFAVLQRMVITGGFGSIFWYLVFSLLFAKPLGILSTITSFDRKNAGQVLTLKFLYQAACLRKDIRQSPLVIFLLAGVQIFFIAIFASPFYYAEGLRFFWREQAPSLLYGLIPLLILAYWLHRRFPKFSTYFTMLFFLSLLFFWIKHLSVLIPVLKIVISDAFGFNSFLTEYAGKGWLIAASSGLCASFFTSIAHSMQLLREEQKMQAKHPLQQAWSNEIQHGVQVVGQSILMLILVAEKIATGPVFSGNLIIGAFLCFNSLRFLEESILSLRSLHLKPLKRVFLISVICLEAAAALLVPGARWFIWRATPYGIQVILTGIIFIILFESNLYHLLLEDYRDRFIWRVKGQYLLPEKPEVKEVEGDS
ncbi:MAG: hypothetical protein VB108_00255 [Anaerolineaceae bacterium]|nr:hypothetical protein [Anaerolineaceae bacterium]